jgi:predicted transcriptional regulator
MSSKRTLQEIKEQQQIVHWEETIVDLEEIIRTLQRENNELRKIKAACEPIGDMRHEILETIIEAAAHQDTDEKRLKQLNAVLEGIFKAVMEWRNAHNSTESTTDAD